MIPELKIVNKVIHPFVSSAYIREDFNEDSGMRTKVLVIQSVPTEQRKTREREACYADFLANLDLISGEIARRDGRFDRIDIRFH